MSVKLKKDKREPVRIQLKKNDQVKVIAGRDRGKTGRVLDVDSGDRAHSGRARQHDQAAYEEESGRSRLPAGSPKKKRRSRFRT